MDDQNKDWQVKNLSKDEARIVFFICNGQDPKDLAYREDLGFEHAGGKTIERHLTGIFKKFDIQGEKKNKKVILITEFCPTVKKLIPTIHEVENWVTTKLPKSAESPDVGKKSLPLGTIAYFVIAFLVIVIAVLGIRHV